MARWVKRRRLPPAHLDTTQSSTDSTGGPRFGRTAARTTTLAAGRPKWEVPVVPRGRPVANGAGFQHEPTLMPLVSRNLDRGIDVVNTGDGQLRERRRNERD